MQLSVACAFVLGIGLSLFMVPIASLLPCLLGTVLIGIGYAPLTSASSQILSSRVPPGLANLIFSIKQTGTPIGAVLAGAVIPSLIDRLGWRGTGLAVAGCAAVIGLLLLPTIRSMDRDHQPSGATRRSFLDPLRSVFAQPALRNLGLASLTFAAMQLTLSSFLTVHLVETVRLRLVDAGLLFAASQAAGVVGRIGWAVVADRLIGARATLVLVGLLMTVAVAVIGWFTPAWPFWLMLVVCLVAGASSTGWNGVALSEIARFAPPGEAGTLTAAVQVLMFAGILLGPPLFSAVLALTGDFHVAFVAIAALTLAGAGFATLTGPRTQA
jgi:predicted MFS family arabinose efflux permease